ncbi:hypothetical protein FFI97_019395 [Variovorax sp. KBS0712]|uniref:hypothetical protein n=1 Tax=Variovorax sp. KBS0712 TaxID=2578111 RepID=UPI0011180BEF|nr:hypothetical protein [Variovorax sp. KBS0712]TSD56400.1 hypothetical protein FFI97_019395 [Variovorax sp. KBS0712]
MEPVESAIDAWRAAWIEACNDYGARKLNSERSLQAALYFHLRSRLEVISSEYRIFIEAAVDVPAVPADPDRDAQPARVIAIDTLVCLGREVLLAVEIKYTPRTFPSVEALKKDLTSLDQIRNRARRDQRVTIELRRHRDTEAGDPMPLKISPDAKMLLGIFCSNARQVDLVEFWDECRPRNAGHWDKSFREQLPPKLGLCIAYAPDPCGAAAPARPVFHGRPFANSPEDHIASRFSGVVGPAFDHEDLLVALAAGDKTLQAASGAGPDAATAARAAMVAAAQQRHPGDRVVSVLALVQCSTAEGVLANVKAATSELRAGYGDAHLVAGGNVHELQPTGVTVALWVRVAI